MTKGMSYPRAIHTRAQYEAALALLDRLLDAEPGTVEGQVVEIPASQIETYEAHHYPIDPPAPVEAVRFRMEQSLPS
jgi:HTH-type transcriptional regulator / antitoxin HigA